MRKLVLPSMFVLLMVLNNSAQESDDDWKKVGDIKESIVYYNAANLMRSDSGTVKVWIKMVAKSKSSAADYVRSRKKSGQSTKGYDKYSFNVNLQEYDCSQRRFRPLFTADYDNERRVLSESNLEEITEWRYIIPGTTGDDILNLVCKSKK